MKNVTSIFIFFLLTVKMTNSALYYIQPYTIYSTASVILRITPHIALNVLKCENTTDINYCNISTYGKAMSGKIYSPDILTSGRNCTNKMCKSVQPGYGYQSLSGWYPVINQDKFIEIISLLLKSISYKSILSFIF